MEKETRDFSVSPSGDAPDALVENQEFKASRVEKGPGFAGKFFNFLGNVAFVALIFMMAVLVFTLVQTRLTGGPPTMFGHQMFIVQGGSMSPAFEAGSLAFIRPVDAYTVKVGDVITYVTQGDSFTTHRVAAVNMDGGELSFTTRGDANLVDDSLPVYPENLVGKVVQTLPYAGFVLSYGQTPTGVLLMVIIPGIFVIAFELRNLFHYAAELEEEKKKEQEQEASFLSAPEPNFQPPRADFSTTGTSSRHFESSGEREDLQ